MSTEFEEWVSSIAPDNVTEGPWVDDTSEPTFERTWRPVDVEPVLDGSWQPAEPTVGRRQDEVGLFYPGRCHTVAAESEGGKTWFALSACLDEMKAGNAALYLDFEDDVGGVVNRLLVMGADRALVRAKFGYIQPLNALGTGIHRDDLDQALGDLRPTIAIIDGITEALGLHGMDPNKNDEVARFGRMLPRRIAGAGAATVSLDHVTKNGESRGRYAIGAVHKLNGVDGAAYVLENRKAFGIGMRGVSTIKIAKDRPGQLRRNGLPSSGGMTWFGDLVVDSKDETFAEVTIEAPHERDESWRPTLFMNRIMVVIEEKGPLSKRLIRAAVTGKAITIDAALDQLILDGYLSESTPHTKLKDWTVEAGVSP